jgi:hypothetical protein
MKLWMMYCLAASIVAPTAIAIARYRGMPYSERFISGLFIIGCANEAIMIAVPYFGIKNLFFIHIYTVAEVILLSCYFILKFENGLARKLVGFGAVVIGIFAMGYAMQGNNLAQFNSIPRALECASLSVLSMYLFFEMSDGTKAINEGDYFINGAILFYFSSSFLVFTFSQSMIQSNDVLIIMYSTHAIINAVCNIIFAIGLWLASRQSYTAA